MTKTEAAEIMALDVRVWARETGRPITRLMCEERVSEWRGSGPSYAGTLKAAAAAIANPKTVLRCALKEARR
jgi:hypothetical protein